MKLKVMLCILMLRTWQLSPPFLFQARVKPYYVLFNFFYGSNMEPPYCDCMCKFLEVFSPSLLFLSSFPLDNFPPTAFLYFFLCSIQTHYARVNQCLYTRQLRLTSFSNEEYHAPSTIDYFRTVLGALIAGFLFLIIVLSSICLLFLPLQFLPMFHFPFFPTYFVFLFYLDILPFLVSEIFGIRSKGSL